MPVLPPELLALTPGTLHADTSHTLVSRVRAAAGAGLAGVLLREPLLPDGPLLELARELRALVAWLGLHDRVHLAAACEADAVHLGFRSLAPADARRLLPGGVALGLSTHAGDDAARCALCDYRFFGPVLSTPSKEGLLAPTGFDGLAAAVRVSPVPVWAIGGIRPEHAALVRQSGARGAAVLSRILASDDPPAATRAYIDAFR
jgi:thiamine-phosphate pyrophosphorylase